MLAGGFSDDATSLEVYAPGVETAVVVDGLVLELLPVDWATDRVVVAFVCCVLDAVGFLLACDGGWGG